MGSALARAAWLAAAMGLVALGVRAQESDCTNGADDDADLAIDCADRDCDLDAACQLRATRNLGAFGPPTWPRTFLGQYYVSFPEFPAFRDIANSNTATVLNPCDLTGRGPDGIVNADDVLCFIMSDLAALPAAFQVSITTSPPDGCRFTARSLVKDVLFGPSSAGAFVEAIDGHGAFAVNTPFAREGRDLLVTFGGQCDASWPGQVIELNPACPCLPSFLHYPYGSLYRSADEILCGLEGLDWNDGDLDGDPDSCPNGIFDGTHRISVQTYDNDPYTQPETDDLVLARTVLVTDLGLVFLGRDFPTAAGEAYVVDVSEGHVPTLFRPPTDGRFCR